jgi:DNA-binding beta-propeller fold protein YncE
MRQAKRISRALQPLCAALVLGVIFTSCGKAFDTPSFDWDLKKPISAFKLGDHLHEVSGLALDASGYLVANNDELAKSYLVSPVDGSTLKSYEFKEGDRSILGDFEGIAQDGAMTWLINSDGFLFRATQGNARINIFDTGLQTLCEVEGLALWRLKQSLVIACKKNRTKQFGKNATVFLWSLGSHSLNPVPLTINRKTLKKRFGIKNFYPSGIAVSHDGSRLLVLSSRRPALAILDAQGALVDARKLRRKYHRQPEGITLLPNGTLVIADEGKSGEATLSLYRRTETR